MEPFGLDLGNGRLATVCGIECCQIAIDTGLNFLHSPLKLGAGEVPIPIVDRLELAAVDGNERFREQSQLLAQTLDTPANGLRKYRSHPPQCSRRISCHGLPPHTLHQPPDPHAASTD